MTTPTPGARRAIVIGCGIAGPTVAMALQQAGIDATIHEASPENSDDRGAFLNVASNGIDALRSLHIAPDLLSAGFPTPRMVLWSHTGKRLGEVANGTTLPDGSVSLTLRRAALHRALRDEASRRGVPIHHEKRLVAIETPPTHVVAHFEDGTSATGDILVGADGIHSPTRHILDPTCPAPRYTGQLSIGGVAPATSLPPTPGEYHMIFGRRAFFGFSVTPSGDAYWFANIAFPTEPARGELRTIPAGEWKRRLTTLFTDDAGPALDMLHHTGDDVAAYPIHDLPTVPRWHRDRILLIGDAAHATSPSSGQGASMAMEDAVTLARCLRDHPDPSRAFTTYESLRRARVERVVRYSRQIGSSKIAGPVTRFFRDLFMPIGLKMYSKSAPHAWLYDHHIDWDARVD